MAKRKKKHKVKRKVIKKAARPKKPRKKKPVLKKKTSKPKKPKKKTTEPSSPRPFSPHPPVTWGREVNAYINFVLYAVSGKMGPADALMRDHRQDILKVAARLQELRPITTKPVYRGLLVEPENMKPGNTIHRDPTLEFVSFSEDKNIACWFADPESAMSQFVAKMQRPRVKGWLVTHTPDPSDILFHWTWGLRFPWEDKEVSLALFGKRHPAFAGMINFNETFESQREVMLLPSDEVLQAIEHEKAGCPPTEELDDLFAGKDPMEPGISIISLRNRKYNRRRNHKRNPRNTYLRRHQQYPLPW